MEAIKALGFRPTDPSLLVPAFREQCAQLAYVGPRSCKSPWTILRLTLSDDVIGTRLIEPINSNLKIRQSRTAPHLKYLYRPTTIEEWWHFIAKLLLKRVKSSGKEPGLSEQEKELVSRLIPDKRYSALKEAHCLNADAIQAFTEALRFNLRRYVALGNFATVDETVIAYYGHDMRVAGIDIKIPRKPHSSGMLRYGLAQRLLYSGAPILIDCESRLPTRRASGPEAFDILVRRNFRINEVDVHIYADSLFCAKGQVANLRRTKARITISFGDNAADDLVKLRSEVVPDMAIGMSVARTALPACSVPTGAPLHQRLQHQSTQMTIYWPDHSSTAPPLTVHLRSCCTSTQLPTSARARCGCQVTSVCNCGYPCQARQASCSRRRTSISSRSLSYSFYTTAPRAAAADRA